MENEVISRGEKTRLTGKALTRRGKKLQILRARGAFFFLPVRFSNDIVHGSWWYVLGSLFSIPMAIVPLIDVFHPFFQVPPETSLNSFSQASTWIILIIMGVFYTIGSLILVRAFEEPIPEPLMKDWKHFCTDELLAAWMFFLAAIPAPIFCLVYIDENPAESTNWAMMFGAILLIITSGWFVYVAYPERHHMLKKNHVLPIVEQLFGSDSFLCFHLANDWLASVWFFLVDFLFFAIGSAYLVAGSYPRPNEDTHIDYDKNAEHTEGLDDVFNPIYHADFSSAIYDNRNIEAGEIGISGGSAHGSSAVAAATSSKPSNNFGKLVKTMNQGLGTQIEPDVPKEEIVQDIVSKYTSGSVNARRYEFSSSSTNHNKESSHSKNSSPERINDNDRIDNSNNYELSVSTENVRSYTQESPSTNNKKKKGNKNKDKKEKKKQSVTNNNSDTHFDEEDIMQL